ncbi:hypothetical protein [Thiomicrorhabdus sp.]|uniref:hypothetical protein n=1 Tax=Thiomicrorhabdus sp. TaxID=2039724 RepID=UPI0029C79B02|nr:hypothetical protein [Thiomicrorhabdus sp.]
MEEAIALLKEVEINRGIALLAVLGFGVFAMLQVFKHMKNGFGVFNVRITGIVIVATLASIIAVLNPSAESAAIGILGAIVGYLFGYGAPADAPKSGNGSESQQQNGPNN